MRPAHIPTYTPARESAHGDTWREHAACLKEDPELFFPNIQGNRARKAAQIAQAKAVCRGCDVLAQCRAYALQRREPSGVWGGLDEEERDRIIRGRQPSRRKQGAKS